MARCSTTLQAGRLRFNGAATARSRMAGRERPQELEARCFNGAATARSRMESFVRDDDDVSVLLQWGRDR